MIARKIEKKLQRFHDAHEKRRSRNSFFFVEACPSSSLIRLIVNCFFTSLLYLFPDIRMIARKIEKKLQRFHDAHEKRRC